MDILKRYSGFIVCFIILSIVVVCLHRLGESKRAPNYADFPKDLIEHPNTKIIEINILDSFYNATITPDKLNFKRGSLLIGVIEGDIRIKEGNAARPNNPLSTLDFSFKKTGKARMSGLSEVVIPNEETLEISLQKELEGKVIHSISKKWWKTAYGTVRIGIHYSPRPLGKGKAPIFSKDIVLPNIASKTNSLSETVTSTSSNVAKKFQETKMSLEQKSALHLPAVKDELSREVINNSQKAKSWLDDRLADFKDYRPKRSVEKKMEQMHPADNSTSGIDDEVVIEPKPL